MCIVFSRVFSCGSVCPHILSMFKGLLSIWKVVTVKKVACRWSANESNLEKYLSVKLSLFKCALDVLDC